MRLQKGTVLLCTDYRHEETVQHTRTKLIFPREEPSIGRILA